MILNKNVPVNTLAELVDYSKKNPDKLNFASMGLGGDSHLIMEWLKHETGAKITHVPYKGFPEAMTSFKANDVQMIALLVGNPDLARQIRDGEVKGLLLPGSTRSTSFRTCRPLPRRDCRRPDRVHALVRLLRAEGHAEGVSSRRMSAEINAIMADAEFRERFLTSKGLDAGGLEARRLRQVPGVRPQGRRRSRRDLRRQARRVKFAARMKLCMTVASAAAWR